MAFAYLAVGVGALAVAAIGAHRSHWLGVAWAFAGLAAARFWHFEDALRETLRAAARAQGLYDARWGPQAALVVLALAGAAVLAWVAWRQWPGWARQSGFAVWLSRWAVIAFAPLMAARLVSWHLLDRLIYSGPVRLNWLADGALTMACALAIALHWRTSRR